MRCRAITVYLCAVCTLSAALAHAQDAFDQVNQARDAFREQRHQEVLRLLEPLVAVPTPSVSGLVEREARKYLGASYVMLNRSEAAERQFEQLLNNFPEHTLNPNAFPAAVITSFEQARSRIQQQGTREQYELKLAELRGRLENVESERDQAQARLVQIEPLAATLEVEQRNSRWIAMLPFGVGQFQNRQRGLGLFFAIGEILLAGASIGTFLWHQFVAGVAADTASALPPAPPTPAQLEVESAEQLSRILNIASLSAFAGLAVIGIVEAQARFVPVFRSTRQRTLPAARLLPSPGGLMLDVRF